MEKGDTCMIVIKNGIRDDSNKEAYWKIWLDQLDILFFIAKSIDSTDDNELVKLHAGDI